EFHVAQARLHLGAIRRLLPGMTRIPDDEREYTNPIIDDEHAEALGAVLDVMTLRPEPFEGICDPIIWTEPGDFTPELGRELLDTWKALRPLEKELVDVTSELSDHLALLGEEVRIPVGEQGARIALGLAEKDARVREALGR